MLIDSLLSARVVTASGSLVTASKTENSDLFWALRGAGSNFGIVTSATYKVYDLTNEGQVFNADFVFAAGQNASVFEAVASYNDVMPPNLAIVQGVAFNPTLGVVSCCPLSGGQRESILTCIPTYPSQPSASTRSSTARRTRRGPPLRPSSPSPTSGATSRSSPGTSSPACRASAPSTTPAPRTTASTFTASASALSTPARSAPSLTS